MSYALETLGKGLVNNLWCIFGRQLARFEGQLDALKVRLGERPQDEELLICTAVTCYRMGRYDEAMAYTARIGEEGAGDRFEGSVIEACVLEALGKRTEAIDTLKNLDRRLEPPDASVRFAIGILYEMTGTIEEAIVFYRGAIGVTPNLYNAHQRLAAICLSMDDVNGGIRHYEELARIDPGDTETRTLLAAMLVNNGQAHRAVSEFQVALTIEPDNWDMQNELVDAFVKAGEYEQAIEVLETQPANQGDFPDTHLQLGELKAKLGRDREATESFTKALEIHPNYLEGMVKFGTHHLRMGRYLQAAEWFSRAIEVNDRLLNAYVGLSVAERHAGWNDRAQQTIELASAVEPNTTMLFAEVAKLELKASAADQAKQYLEPRDDADDQGKDVGSELLAIQAERFAQAIGDNPDRADWHYRYGLLLKAQAKPAQAAEEFAQAVAINPDYVKALIKLGLVCYELGRTEQAQQHLERAVILEPGYADVHYQLGLIYSDQNRYEFAIEQFEESLRRSEDGGQVRGALALALENIGLTDRARASWKAVIELAPESEQAKLAKAALGN